MRADFEAVHPGRPFTTKVRDARLPYRFTDARVRRGELYIERAPASGYCIVEPHHKAIQVNRAWPWDRWQAVVDAVRVDWVQLNPPGERLLSGVRHMPCTDMVRACRVLSGARLYLGPEGGLYHAAAALGVPAVALFGGFVSPANQGYEDPTCRNLYEPMNGESPCGQRVPCAHCAAAMARISVEQVIHHVRDLLLMSRPADSAAAL